MDVLGLPNLQGVYDAGDGTLPTILLDTTRNGIIVRDDAGGIGGDLLAIQDGAAANLLAVQDGTVTVSPAGAQRWQMTDTVWDLGRTGRRIFSGQWPDTTGRMGIETFPDDFSITTATGTNNSLFFSDASRVITLNIPAGGGLGNDTAPGFVNWTHRVRFEDLGFLFASQLLVNAAVVVEAAGANVGPVYLFLDQYTTRADGSAQTCSQHNAMRAQPRWGPNVAGGSITQTSAELYFAATAVDATVGSASITTLTHFTSKGVTLTAGGTVGTFTAYEIVDVTGPSTIYGINSAMSTGTFIRHTGAAVSEFAGDLHMNNGISLVLGTPGANRVDLLRPAAGTLRMIGVGGTNNEGLDWDFDAFPNNVSITSPTGASLNFDTSEIAFGPSTVADGTNNWVFAFSPGLRATNLAGDYSEVLFTSSSAISVGHAITNFATWTINAPTISLTGGSIVDAANVLIQTSMSQGTNRYGLLVTSNPVGGTLNYCARFQGAAGVLIDGPLDTGAARLIAEREISGATTLSATTDHVVLCETTGGTFTVTLPAVAGNAGLTYEIKNIGTNTLTIDGNGAETIDGALTAVLSSQYDSITLVCDGTEWWIL